MPLDVQECQKKSISFCSSFCEERKLVIDIVYINNKTNKIIVKTWQSKHFFKNTGLQYTFSNSGDRFGVINTPPLVIQLLLVLKNQANTCPYKNLSPSLFAVHAKQEQTNDYKAQKMQLYLRTRSFCDEE